MEFCATYLSQNIFFLIFRFKIKSVKIILESRNIDKRRRCVIYCSTVEGGSDNDCMQGCKVDKKRLSMILKEVENNPERSRDVSRTRCGCHAHAENNEYCTKFCRNKKELEEFEQQIKN